MFLYFTAVNHIYGTPADWQKWHWVRS